MAPVTRELRELLNVVLLRKRETETWMKRREKREKSKRFPDGRKKHMGCGMVHDLGPRPVEPVPTQWMQLAQKAVDNKDKQDSAA